MLEIIYDPTVLTLNYGNITSWMGFKPGRVTAVLHDGFSEYWPHGDGSVSHLQGTRTTHLCFGSEYGTPNKYMRGAMTFIVPVTPETQACMSRLKECDGLFVEGVFFETLETRVTDPHQVLVDTHFTIPPNHFYFFGEKSHVV